MNDNDNFIMEHLDDDYEDDLLPDIAPGVWEILIFLGIALVGLTLMVFGGWKLLELVGILHS